MPCVILILRTFALSCILSVTLLNVCLLSSIYWNTPILASSGQNWTNSQNILHNLISLQKVFFFGILLWQEYSLFHFPIFMLKCKFNLAKPDCVLDQRPTVMFGEKRRKKSVEKGAYKTPCRLWSIPKNVIN